MRFNRIRHATGQVSVASSGSPVTGVGPRVTTLQRTVPLAVMLARENAASGAGIRHLKADPASRWLRPTTFDHSTAKPDPGAFGARCSSVRLSPSTPGTDTGGPCRAGLNQTGAGVHLRAHGGGGVLLLRSLQMPIKIPRGNLDAYP
jgi:hypothetical protein